MDGLLDEALLDDKFIHLIIWVFLGGDFAGSK